MPPDPPDAPILHCSFCGKSQHEIQKLIAGSAAFICDECIEACVEIAFPHSERNTVMNELTEAADLRRAAAIIAKASAKLDPTPAQTDLFEQVRA